MPTLLRQVSRVQRPRAAERHQRELARILALLLQREAQIHRHLGVDDAQDALGRADGIEAQRLADALVERAPRRRFVEPHACRRADVAADSAPSTRFASVTVGSVAALAIARGARHRRPRSSVRP